MSICLPFINHDREIACVLMHIIVEKHSPYATSLKVKTTFTRCTEENNIINFSEWIIQFCHSANRGSNWRGSSWQCRFDRFLACLQVGMALARLNSKYIWIAYVGASRISAWVRKQWRIYWLKITKIPTIRAEYTTSYTHVLFCISLFSFDRAKKVLCIGRVVFYKSLYLQNQSFSPIFVSRSSLDSYRWIVRRFTPCPKSCSHWIHAWNGLQCNGATFLHNLSSSVLWCRFVRVLLLLFCAHMECSLRRKHGLRTWPRPTCSRTTRTFWRPCKVYWKLRPIRTCTCSYLTSNEPSPHQRGELLGELALTD